MGEAMLESGVYANAKARALLEVVRLAFEDGIGIGSAIAESSCATTAADAEVSVEAHGSVRGNARSGKEGQPSQPVQRATHTGNSSRLIPGGPCTWCGVTSTPQWRRPRGTNKLLCNACGIFFTRYGKLPERTQHAYTHTGSAAARSNGTRAAAAAAAAAGPTALMPMEGEQLQCHPWHDEPAAKRTDDGGDQPRASSEPSQHHRPRQRSLSQQPVRATSPLAMVSPYKRKDAPQPEADLLQCMEESAGSPGEDGGAPAALAPLASFNSLPQAFQPLQTPLADMQCLQGAPPQGLLLPAGGSGAVAAGTGLAAAGAAPDANQPPPLLTVAPLDLGLQHFGVQQLDQLRLLPPVENLTGRPPLPPLRLADAAAPRACSAAAAPSLLPAPLSMLPPDLLGRPFTLSPGLLPSGASFLDAQPPPRSLYARPPKRQERLPLGDSEDSNASTDSHAATLHGGASHEEDDGGTTLLGSSINSTKGGPLSSSPASSGLQFQSHTLFGRPGGVPLLAGAPAHCTAGALALPPGAFSGGGGSVGLGGLATVFAMQEGVPGASPLAGSGPGQERPEAGPIILLQTRRSKGPRSRASSATPSSSTQS